MSEGDVSLIQDEDVLRRMWQQTEDFSRKKEIRTHMYRLREERLRNLYSPEPGVGRKGCEFTSTHDHVKSFADQSFQSMKSKEVRDAGSPPKEFSYYGQDLKELSNAGWNVESENRTTDDGHTHVKSTNANIEGRYDVDGGHGQFAAVDRQKQAITEYEDENTKLKRNENITSSAAHEQVVRQLDDGSHFSSTTTSSSSTSKYHETSTQRKPVPYISNDDEFDNSTRKFYDDNQNENITFTREKVIKESDYDQNIKNTNYEHGDLVSRKIDYPDENTKVIVETRCLPDGSRVTSTRREFRAPVVQTSHQESKSETKHSSHSSSNNHMYTSSETEKHTQSSSKLTRESSDINKYIVQSQRNIDDNDFKTKPRPNIEVNDDNYMGMIDTSKKQTQRDNEEIRNETILIKETKNFESEQNLRNDKRVQSTFNVQNNNKEEKVENTSSSNTYETTYQTDYNNKKISNDLSPAHQAWASTLRSDTPTRPTTRASSPGGKTFKSSTSSLRSSISPDKTFRKSSSRGSSPNKIDRQSPARLFTNHDSNVQSTYCISETRSKINTNAEKNTSRPRSPSKYPASPDNMSPNERLRSSQSPEKRPFQKKTNSSPDKETFPKNPLNNQNKQYPDKPKEDTLRPNPDKTVVEKTNINQSPYDSSLQHTNITTKTETSIEFSTDSSLNSDKNRQDKIPGYMRSTEASVVKLQDIAGDITSELQERKISKPKADHYKFVDEETKMYTRTDTEKSIAEDVSSYRLKDKSPSPVKHPRRKSPSKEYSGKPDKISTSPISDTKTPNPESQKTMVSSCQTRKSISPQRNSQKEKSPVQPPQSEFDKNRLLSNSKPIRTSSPVKDSGISSNDNFDSFADKTKENKISHIIKHNEHELKDIKTTNITSASENRDISPSKFGTFKKTTNPDQRMLDFENSQKTLIKTNIAKTLSKSRSTSPDKTLSKTSPDKYLSKDKKQSHDFIKVERSTEETNKKSAHDRPRQLITPSTSPTRKPIVPEREPSTGQSSPTTSVSGFIYFSSPSSDKTIITDLDSHDTYTIENTEETIAKEKLKQYNNRSPSPTKIPYKSPSPEKRPTKESLPRKSSLKKPSNYNSQMSPTEKPPTSFLISPSDEAKYINTETRNNKNDSQESNRVKPKPPFERRETYEERCLKILGMMQDSTVTSDISQITVSDNLQNMPSEYTDIFNTTQKPEKAENLLDGDKGKLEQNKITDKPKKLKTNKTPSREMSPTKLQDIIATSNTNKEIVNELSDTYVLSVKSNPLIDKENLLQSSVIPPISLKEISNDGNDSVKEIKPAKISKPDSKMLHDTNNLSVGTSTEKSERKILTQKNIVIGLEENDTTHTTEDLKKYCITDVVEDDNINSDSIITRDDKSETLPSKKITNTASHDITKMTDHSTELIKFEREQEETHKIVGKSLRNFSPDRKNRTASPTKILGKDAIENFNDDNMQDGTDTQTMPLKVKDEISTLNKQKPNKFKDQKPRNVSPTKKPNVITPRSISPKKTMSSPERPQSPHLPKTGINKPKDQNVLNSRKSGTGSPNKLDKTISSDLKKNTTKQVNTSRIFITKGINKINQYSNNKIEEQENKRTSLNKNIKDSKKKETEIKVTRTASDIMLRTKKTLPQKIKSKPEIHVNDISTNNKQSSLKYKMTKEPQAKLPTNKPKSATALNTSIDEDNDFTIDVQQAKSSRENSPDRICPTPLGVSEDIGTPRFPDEVSEPDDEFQKRTYKTIQEHESLVDDIVEICEEEELFVTSKNIDRTEGDKKLPSINDEVSNISTQIKNIKKTKDISSRFKDTEKRCHSDYNEDNLNSDECLLSVSEKVNKFGKVSSRPKDSKSPTRNILEEYDIQTTYQDDYTKLSVNDKAHLFIETAENVKSPKSKPIQKLVRPDLSNVDEDLKSDDCLLSVSDKVSKFVKTAEQFLNETQEQEETEQRIKEQHNKIMKQIVENAEDIDVQTEVTLKSCEDKKQSTHRKEIPTTPQLKIKSVDKATSRSNDAVKKAKALFENIASTQKTKETTNNKSTKTTDITFTKTSLKDNSKITTNIVDNTIDVVDDFNEIDGTITEPKANITTIKTPVDIQASPNQLRPRSPIKSRPKSPARPVAETITTTKTTITRIIPVTASTPHKLESQDGKIEKPHDTVPSYQRPTKTSQLREETNIVEESDRSSRRGSGKFGVELRRTSIERSSVSSERRRNSVEHHQPCIEDIFDVDLLEQMLEKVVGYEQRRRIRAQIRVAKKKFECEQTANTTTIKTTKNITKTCKTKSPDRRPMNGSHERSNKSIHRETSSPERRPKSALQKTLSPERPQKQKPDITPSKSGPNNEKQLLNGDTKEHINPEKNVRPHSPSKPSLKHVSNQSQSPFRPASPEKRRPRSPTKSAIKQKSNRFNEYATAYMKKVGLDEDKKIIEVKKKTPSTVDHKIKKTEILKGVDTKQISSVTTERTSSKDVLEIVQLNGKRTPSPEKIINLKRKSPSPERKLNSHERKISVSETQNATHYPETPEIKRHPSDMTKKQNKKETIIKTVHDIEKKIPQKQPQEEKPTWVTNRNLKKISSETRTFSSKKIETEKSKYRAASPSKVISKPIDVITSSYGPGPLDADGRPLFGIKALRNGASNFQVKGTVIRQEFHSRNGGEPEGTVSVTAYSTEPEDLEKLLQVQGEKPSRLHGLAAITTTKKFGGDTGTTYSEITNKEERAALDQFTHSDRRVSDTRVTSIDDSVYKKEISQRARQEPQEAENDKRKVLKDKTKETQRKFESENIERKSETENFDKRSERTEKRMEEKKTVRQSSVKSLTEKYIKSANDTTKSDRTTYPKAGLILRTTATTMKDSVSNESSANPGLTRSDSEHSVDSVEDIATTTTTTTEQVGDGVRTTTTTTKRSGHTRTQERSFLDSTSKVTGVQDILTRMKNADIVIEEGDTNEDTEARALLNKFLGATVLMAGMQSYVTEKPTGKVVVKETIQSGGKTTSSSHVEHLDIEQCWDERVLKKLLDECTEYEQRRKLRARIRTVMAEQEACASAVTEALAAAGESVETEEQTGEREEEEVTTVTSSVRRNSSEKTVSSSTTIKNSKVIESMTRPAPKPVSPFAKFRQLEKQNSTNSSNSAKSPQSPGSPSQPYFKFTDPALQASAVTIKERLLQWCRDKTRDYENVKLENFSTSWADGLAFCALIHHFLPDAFDYSELTPEKRRHNFTLAFKIADEKAGIYPLLDVDDMVAMRKPDWKCVFTYVQSIHRRFKDDQ